MAFIFTLFNVAFQLVSLSTKTKLNYLLRISKTKQKIFFRFPEIFGTLKSLNAKGPRFASIILHTANTAGLVVNTLHFEVPTPCRFWPAP